MSKTPPSNKSRLLAGLFLVFLALVAVGGAAILCCTVLKPLFKKTWFDLLVIGIAILYTIFYRKYILPQLRGEKQDDRS